MGDSIGAGIVEHLSKKELEKMDREGTAVAKEETSSGGGSNNGGDMEQGPTKNLNHPFTTKTFVNKP